MADPKTTNRLKMKNALALSLVFDTDIAPILMDRPPGDRILVLAPHMDDEILGCGGTLRKHLLAGNHVTVAYMTDGRKGSPSSYEHLPREERDRREDELVRVRRDESRRATAHLGSVDLRFLDNRDQELSDTPAAASELGGIIEEVRPDTVYLPFMTDRHRDHWMTNRVFLKALAQLRRNLLPERCCAYEVWTPLIPNCLVDITEVIDLKRKALQEFTSQMTIIDFSRSILGLHAYRSMIHLQGRGYAEGFYLTDPHTYRSVFETMSR